jgi:hypothetical protein
MTTQTDTLTPLEKHLKKVIEEGQKAGIVTEEVAYKDRVRIHVKLPPPQKK